MKRYFTIAALGMAVSLSACSVIPKTPAAPAGKQETAAKETTAQETLQDDGIEEEGMLEENMPAESGEEEDLETAMFRSSAYVVQMEITTGLTTEYLDPLLNYPVKVIHGDQEDVIKNMDDLDQMGLEALYTPELLEAVGDFDVENNMEIQDGKVILGDLDTAYVILEKDANDVIGISEFHYND